MKTNQTNNNIQLWDEVLDLALKMPFVKVDRDNFLRAELQGMCKPEPCGDSTANAQTHCAKLHQLSHQIRHGALLRHRSSRWIHPFRHNPC